MVDKKNSAYDGLAEMTESGQLRLISLLAPARSSSTALERALLESPDIHLQVNDPFAIYDSAEREEKTYEYILGRIREHGKTPVTVLVKNVADYIPPGDCWERWSHLCSRHLFLVRNPLLTLHSLFKMMVKHYKPEQVAVAPLTMDDYAKGKGFKDWAELQKKLSGGDNFAEYDDLYRALFTRDQKIHHDDVMRIPVVMNIPMQAAVDAGYRSRDDFSATLGDRDWDATLQYLTQPYASLLGFEKILERAFAWRITGWEALYQHFRHAPGAFVMDSTMFRSAPDAAMRAISEALGIAHSARMLAWQDNPEKPFTTDYDGEVPYYDRIVKSQGIDPPVEKPPLLGAFPPSFRPHLTGREGCFDIYLRMLNRMDPVFVASFQLTDELKSTDPVFARCLAEVFPGRFAPVENEKFADLFAAISRLS
jgi:hypothetical protein